MAEALEVTPAELDAFADRLGEVESYLHLDEKRTRVTELEAKRDRKSTRLNSSHWNKSRMPSSA